MTLCKVFTASNEYELEQQVNTWLEEQREELENLNIKRILQSEASVTKFNGEISYLQSNITLTIFYIK